MAMMNPLQNYQQNAVNTASPGELTLMLYNGCLKFIHLAKLAIKESRLQDKNTNLVKAQKIIQELMITLNMEQEVSKQLMPLYDYLHRQLIQANIKNDINILDEVEGFVVEFRDTWKEVIQLNRQKTYQQSDLI
ncbi:flagellar export chaperone FliS [Bacillus sp. RG28]|uniref:Flagellar secretion chaperone FliS n=1 Tax=Gottfriedia endophytica TaxID=2820819 RepID=A0A940SK57_9BACI|nr:flagellar export chaperone FliS [Gottfriedia endophytica]MBP0726725.1 flagellar export chaperone FliS [Gottfriedia endophytica]